jgi:hypothetical protein
MPPQRYQQRFCNRVVFMIFQPVAAAGSGVEEEKSSIL